MLVRLGGAVSGEMVRYAHRCYPVWYVMQTDKAEDSFDTYRLSTAPRSLAVLLLQDGNAAAAAAIADLVSAAFMQATLAMTSSVAGLLTCKAVAPLCYNQQGVGVAQQGSRTASTKR